VLGERDALGLRPKLDRVEDVARERGPTTHDLVSRVENRERQVHHDRVGSRGDGDVLELDTVLLGERRPEAVGASVGVAVQLRCPSSDRFQSLGERPELALVRGELDNAVEAKLALDLLDRLPGLVRDQRAEGRTEERLVGDNLIFSAMTELGLFPLNLVLLPGEQAPLHVFEPRYKELIGECLAENEEFGLVLADDDGIREIGTRAGVIEVLERFDDGRLNVVIEGRERFRLVEVTEGLSYQTADVVDIDDDGEQPTEEEVEQCLAAYDRVVKAADAELEDLDFDADSIAFQIAARVDFGTEIKQGLLELQSERERVLRLAPMLNQAADAVRRDRDIRERASGNGRVEPL
jgi:Lon protease-like protein